jgi:hypothetical protein
MRAFGWTIVCLPDLTLFQKHLNNEVNYNSSPLHFPRFVKNEKKDG